jgi:hypothetical protein
LCFIEVSYDRQADTELGMPMPMAMQMQMAEEVVGEFHITFQEHFHQHVVRMAGYHWCGRAVPDRCDRDTRKRSTRIIF